MQELFEAIKTQFDTVNSLRTAVSDRLYLVNAPQGATLPYVVYFLVANPVDYNFTSTFDNPQIQFSLFAETTTNIEILNLHNYLKALYDDCVLTVTGYQFVKMERTLDLGLIKDVDQNVWHYPVQYDVWLRK